MNTRILGYALAAFLPFSLIAMDSSRFLLSCTLEKENGVVTYASHLYTALQQNQYTVWLVVADKSPLTARPKRLFR